MTQRGYKKEELGRLAESYGRYLNAERMANTEEKAEAFAEDSDFQQRVDALVMTGFSEEDAKKIVYEQLYYELVIASTEGFLGGVL